MQPSFRPSILAILVYILVTTLPGTVIYARYIGIARPKAFLLALAAAIVGVAMMIQHERQVVGHGGAPAVVLLSTGLFFLVLTPYAARLYRKWIADDLTVDEKLPGPKGYRAWLHWSNLLCAFLLAVTLSIGWGYSLLGCLTLALLPLLAYSTLNLGDSTAVPPQEASRVSGASERDRILKMLDEGKITAAESADLLNALGHTRHEEVPRRGVMLPGQRLVLIGAALVLLGFFLPWFSISPGAELNRLLGGIRTTIGTMTAPVGAAFDLGLPAVGASAVVRISGGDVGRGLGWLVLTMSCAVAVLPYLHTTFDAATQRTIRFLAFGVGAVIAMYLFTQNLRFLSIGMLVVIAGYAMECVGLLKETPRAAAVSSSIAAEEKGD